MPIPEPGVFTAHSFGTPSPFETDLPYPYFKENTRLRRKTQLDFHVAPAFPGAGRELSRFNRYRGEALRAESFARVRFLREGALLTRFVKGPSGPLAEERRSTVYESVLTGRLSPLRTSHFSTGQSRSALPEEL